MNIIAHHFQTKHELNCFVWKSIPILVFIALIKWTYLQFTELVELSHSSGSDNVLKPLNVVQHQSEAILLVGDISHVVHPLQQVHIECGSAMIVSCFSNMEGRSHMVDAGVSAKSSYIAILMAIFLH